MGGDRPCQQGGVTIGAAKNIRSDKSGQRKKKKGRVGGTLPFTVEVNKNTSEVLPGSHFHPDGE